MRRHHRLSDEISAGSRGDAHLGLVDRGAEGDACSTGIEFAEPSAPEFGYAPAGAPIRWVARIAANGVALTCTLSPVEIICGRDCGAAVADDQDLAAYLGEYWSASLRGGLQPWSYQDRPDIGRSPR